MLQAGLRLDAPDIHPHAGGQTTFFPQAQVVADLIRLPRHLVNPRDAVRVQVPQPLGECRDTFCGTETGDHGV